MIDDFDELCLVNWRWFSDNCQIVTTGIDKVIGEIYPCYLFFVWAEQT